MIDPLVVLKAGLDSGAGLANIATRTLLEAFNPQNMNVFEIILTPAYPSIGAGIDIATSNSLAKLHLKSINPSFVSIEYENLNERKGKKGLIYPEEVTLTFIENQEGAVRNYLNSWLKQIVVIKDRAINKFSKSEWVFKDNQQASEKNAVIIPLTRVGAPSTGWIQINGLDLKSVGALEFSQESAEMMIITATCKVDNIWFKTIA